MKQKRSLPAKLEPKHLRWAIVEAGDKLRPALRRRIIAVGEAAVPEIYALLIEVDLQLRFVHHAVSLLSDLGSAGHQALITSLSKIQQNTGAFDEVLQALVRLGPPIAPVLLKTLISSSSTPQDAALEILALCGAKSDEILKRLLEYLSVSPAQAATCLSDYGDPIAVPVLLENFNTAVLSEHELHMGNVTIKELGTAILSLGGQLSSEQTLKLNMATAMLKHQQHALTFDFHEND
jgi:hypothetical protein